MSNLENPEGVKNYVEKVAEKNQWRLNPDRSFTSPILKGLSDNFNRYGCLACPCRDVSGIKEQDRDILCPCQYAKKDVEEFGQCYCGLFLSDTKDPDEVASIPERRPDSF